MFKKVRNNKTTIIIIVAVILVISSYLYVTINKNNQKINLTAEDNQITQEKVLVMGVARSGTSALFTSIGDAWGTDTDMHYEPESFDVVFNSQAKKVLTKIVFSHGYRYAENFKNDLKKFDKKVLIIRDPRDVLVSALLYFSRWKCFQYIPEKQEKFIKALQQKEQDPSSIPFFELYALRDNLEKSMAPLISHEHDLYYDLQEYKKAIKVAQEAQKHDIFIIRYEDYIDGKTAKLDKYLNDIIRNPIHNDPYVHFSQKVEVPFARTKKYGNWKNWFTKDDVELFKKLYGKHHESFMKDFGYTNWKTNDKQIINPQHSSKYVLKYFSGHLDKPKCTHINFADYDLGI